MVNITHEEFLSALRMRIINYSQALADEGYNEGPVRARVVQIASRYGGPVLDVGTGTHACMAVPLARRGLKVTAIDHDSSAVRIAQERAAGKLSETLEVRYAHGSHLPFAAKSYRVVLAFDMLCHSSNPAAVISEMFRVSNGVVIISELNSVGRRITKHLDNGFETQLPSLLAEHCKNCQRFDDTHHITYVCEEF